ncbi:MAG TPA: alpha-galactosidase [Prolixibacteraceae bacterium]|nr:alpha-galactosidase [Prolixibacteraceae bacterium]
MKKSILFLLSLMVALQLFSQTDNQAVNGKQIVIETKHTALVYSVAKNKKLNQVYLGEKLNNAADYQLQRNTHEAYPSAGTDNLFEPAIRMLHNDGNPSLELLFAGEKTVRDGNVTSTAITLKDPVYPVTVILNVVAYDEEDIIKTWTEISHQEKSPVTLSNYASAMIHMDADHYFLTQFHGDWAKEMRMEESELTSGIKTIDSKLGTRANIFQTPLFFVSRNKPADEFTGEVFAGTLGWTGSFQLSFEIDNGNSLRMIAGINPYASEYHLKPNENFVTPEFIFTYSTQGKGQASRNFHQWARNYGVMDGHAKRLTLLNNWEATYFDFDENKLTELFGGAKELGVDVFLLDDGWFANKYPRNNDGAGLGDWQENTQKLPHGLGYLVEQAEAKGVKFGIWIEPEMVNPKSELYEKHPDWILKLPNRDENYYRNQLVLDLTNPKVQDFVYNVVDEMLTKNPRIGYIKWDCNRMMTNTYSPYLKDQQSHVQIEYVRSFYRIMEKLRVKYPHLPIMLCSGGGGRTDYGALRYFTEFWPSDNTDAAERVYIQWGYSYFFPSMTSCNHITTMGKQSLKYKTDVAMMGKMGYDIRVNELTADELEFSKMAVQNYNNLKELIWSGDLYRLISPYEEERAVLMYANQDKTKAVLFSYALHPRAYNHFSPVRLTGLDPAKSYKVQEINRMKGQWSPFPAEGKTFSGDYLIKAGLLLPNNNELSSAVIEITEVK